MNDMSNSNLLLLLISFIIQHKIRNMLRSIASQITLIIMFENVVIVTCVKYEDIYRKRRNEKATTEIKIVHT